MERAVLPYLFFLSLRSLLTSCMELLFFLSADSKDDSGSDGTLSKVRDDDKNDAENKRLCVRTYTFILVIIPSIAAVMVLITNPCIASAGIG